MSDIGLYAELHFVLFITFDKDLQTYAAPYHIIATCQALDLIIESYP